MFRMDVHNVERLGKLIAFVKQGRMATAEMYDGVEWHRAFSQVADWKT